MIPVQDPFDAFAQWSYTAKLVKFQFRVEASRESTPRTLWSSGAGQILGRRLSCRETEAALAACTDQAEIPAVNPQERHIEIPG